MLAVADRLVALRPDVLVLTDIDHDLGGAALGALADLLAQRGLSYPHRFHPTPNTGIATGLDLDRNGRLGEARDAQGYGRFPGDGGLAVLSRLPLGVARDLSNVLWRDLPGNRMTEAERADDRAPVQRLGTAGHWILTVEGPSGAFDLWLFAATPPVFDGPEDRNGRRNADEIALWLRLLDGSLPERRDAPFVIAGLANLDPLDGEGLHETIAALLSHPELQDPRPASPGGPAAARDAHRGDPAFDTADFGDPEPGNLRVSYVLPSRDWQVTGAGVDWPVSPDDTGLRHKMVWADLTLPRISTRRRAFAALEAAMSPRRPAHRPP